MRFESFFAVFLPNRPKTSQGAVAAGEKRAAPVLEAVPFEEAPFDEPPPEPDLFAARRAEPEKVDALASDKRKAAFGYFMRTLRSGSKNGVLFTMCQDLEPSFEGDKFVLSASSEVIFRSLNREEHFKSIKTALEKIGITDFDIRLKGAKADTLDEDIARLKKDFAGTDIEEK